MKPIYLFVFGLLIAGAVVTAVFMAGEPAKPADATPAVTKTANLKGEGPEVTAPAITNTLGSDAVPSPPNAPAPFVAVAMTNDVIFNVIQEASTSYNAKELPKIQPYLTHPDAEIREAAINGIINLGDAAGSPLLRAAAKNTTDSKEAVKMLQAADYLELPSGSLRGRGGKRKARAQVSRDPEMKLHGPYRQELLRKKAQEAAAAAAGTNAAQPK